MEEPIRHLFPDETRLHHCLHSIEVMMTNHISAATGVRQAGPLEYVFPARTAAELEATKGHDATHVAPQRPTERVAAEPTRPQMTPTQPARTVKTPW